MSNTAEQAEFIDAFCFDILLLLRENYNDNASKKLRQIVEKRLEDYHQSKQVSKQALPSDDEVEAEARLWFSGAQYRSDFIADIGSYAAGMIAMRSRIQSPTIPYDENIPQLIGDETKIKFEQPSQNKE